MEPDTVLIEDPFRVINTLWEAAPGLDDTSAPEAWRNWRRRVARYLFWSIDGGLHPGEMDLTMLVRCQRMHTCTMRSRDTLERLFDFFVHMATDEHPYELDSATLADKVNDPQFMQSFTMNKRPLLVLLERGFLQRTLEEEAGGESQAKYVEFLAQMLQRPFEETGTELLVAICNQIALMSQIDMNRQKLIGHHVLIQLIELLQAHDDVLLLAVAKALVNLSSGNRLVRPTRKLMHPFPPPQALTVALALPAGSLAKDSIVNEGGVRALIPHLLNKPPELTRAFCVLLKNCLTAPELRERIINDGAVAPLVKLLHKSEIKGANRGDAVVAAAAAAVWNLTAHQPAKQQVKKERAVEALVQQLQTSNSSEVSRSVSACRRPECHPRSCPDALALTRVCLPARAHAPSPRYGKSAPAA